MNHGRLLIRILFRMQSTKLLMQCALTQLCRQVYKIRLLTIYNKVVFELTQPVRGQAH